MDTLIYRNNYKTDKAGIKTSKFAMHRMGEMVGVGGETWYAYLQIPTELVVLGKGGEEQRRIEELTPEQQKGHSVLILSPKDSIDEQGRAPWGNKSIPWTLWTAFHRNENKAIVGKLTQWAEGAVVGRITGAKAAPRAEQGEIDLTSLGL